MLCVFSQSECTSFRSETNTLDSIFHWRGKGLTHLPLGESGLTSVLVWWHHSWQRENTIAWKSHATLAAVTTDPPFKSERLAVSPWPEVFPVNYYLFFGISC